MNSVRPVVVVTFQVVFYLQTFVRSPTYAIGELHGREFIVRLLIFPIFWNEGSNENNNFNTHPQYMR